MGNWGMTADLARRLMQTVDREVANLRFKTDEQASVPRAPGKWCAKEELGHLIDSASNNHIRFVVGALDGHFQGASYAQDEWVRLHGYTTMSWSAIVELWFAYNSLLSGLLDRIPESRLKAQCVIGTAPPVSLEFLVDDYILHMQHHIDQLLLRDVITPYPRAVAPDM
jgi:DinB family protein